MRRDRGKGRVRLPHLLGCQRKALKRDVVKAQGRVTFQFRHHRQKIEAGAEPGLGNGEVTVVPHARGKVIAIQEHMPALGKSVISIVVAILKHGRMRHPVNETDLGRREVVVGANMW